MPRQLFHIALSLLLLLSTTGFAVKKHYCLGMHRYTTLAVFDPPCCSPDKEMPFDCCHDVITHYQLEADFTAATPLDWQSITLDWAFLPPPASLALPLFSFSRPFSNQHYKPPPLTTDIPVRVQAFLL